MKSSFNSPLITIVIPTFNGELTIKKTVDSVLAQTYENWELIIINNHSNDSTLEIVKKYSDKRIIIIDNENNIGFEANWNKALTFINGKYFKLLPDDDILVSNNLEFAVQILENNTNLVMVTSKRNIINEKDKLLMVRGKDICLHKCNYANIIKNIFRYGSNPFGEPGAVLFRSHIIKTNAIKFDMSIPYFIDLDFYLKILKFGGYQFIDKPLYSFRIWSRSYSVENEKCQLFDTYKFFNTIQNNYKFISLYDIVINRFNISKNSLMKNLFYFYLKYVK